MHYREASVADAMEIARLHAESWRATYRGVYRDEYLDNDVLQDRIDVWSARFSVPPENQFVVVAEEGGHVTGFACVHGCEDKHWGSLLDNIHVHPGQHRRGTGSGLVNEVVKWCRARFPGCGLYLWVLEQNVNAQRFYQRLGAVDRGGEDSVPPGGGLVHGRRYVWATLDDIVDLSKG